ncbi:MAG: hypothetical protein M0015_05525 [Betaproteobacteria bacterium]|nr:hypothetical protein [Betaproteobacteria bacterium]
MTRKTKTDELPPVYEVDVLPVERRLFPRGRRSQQGGPIEVEKDGKKVVVERRRSPGRRTSDREPGGRES